MRVFPLVPAIVLGAALAGCGGGDAGPGSVSTPVPSDQVTPAQVAARADLAARAAAAQDLVGISFYTLVTAEGEEDRTVMVVRAEDGGWRVDVPGGALDGTADVSIVTTPGGGLHHCTLGASPTAEAEPEPDEDGEPELPAACVGVAELRPQVDPRVQHVFTDWLEVLMDRSAPLAVAAAPAPDGVTGDCFQVEPSTASLVAPLDGGVYCFAPDGTLTGARLELGDLTLAGGNEVTPASVDLPGPVVDGEPLPVASPTPTPTGTPSER